MGGQLSLYAACANADVGACVNFYGIHPNVHPHIANLQAPVLDFAEKDSSVTPEAARRLEAELKGAGKQAEFHIYPGVGHASFNDTRPDVYNATYAKQGGANVLKFLREHLGECLILSSWGKEGAETGANWQKAPVCATCVPEPCCTSLSALQGDY
jgi:carboxymethylenebutenolidase